MSVYSMPHGNHYYHNNKYSFASGFESERIEQELKDIPLLGGSDQDSVAPEEDIEEPKGSMLGIADESYTTNYGNYTRKLSQRDAVDISTPMRSIDVVGLLGDGDNDGHASILDIGQDSPSMLDYIPSQVVDYYNEATLKAKDRKELDDEEFGLPRQRSYPLNDEAHVRQAIRMFRHCKDPKDREELARNIFKAIKKFDMDVTIGKDNPLWEYAPENLREDAVDVYRDMIGSLKDDSRDPVKSHLEMNAAYFNNVFYGDFGRSIRELKKYDFLDYFYPSLRGPSFIDHLEVCLGGLARASKSAKYYRDLGMRDPHNTRDGEDIGWRGANYADRYNEYDRRRNWFKVSTKDTNHIIFCLRLYSVMAKILLDRTFNPDIDLEANHRALLLDWGQRVEYHHGILQEAETEKERLIQHQYLFDLFWNGFDNPNDQDVIATNVVNFVGAMVGDRDIGIHMNETELLSKEKCTKLLAKDLDSDTIFLCPKEKKYPVLDGAGVHLAMDRIAYVPKNELKDYVKNLNRRYKELGCDFKISVDHPFAKYMAPEFVDRIDRILSEGEATAVADQGTSFNSPDKYPSLTEKPWYIRNDYVHGVAHNFLEDKELGPNTKKMQVPNYTQHDSFL